MHRMCILIDIVWMQLLGFLLLRVCFDHLRFHHVTSKLCTDGAKFLHLWCDSFGCVLIIEAILTAWFFSITSKHVEIRIFHGDTWCSSHGILSFCYVALLIWTLFLPVFHFYDFGLHFVVKEPTVTWQPCLFLGYLTEMATKSQSWWFNSWPFRDG